MKKFSILGVLLLLLATLSLSAAQTPRTVTIQMQAVMGSKVAGTAVITEVGQGIRVNVRLTGYNPNQGSAGHIHSSTCTPGGPVVFPLSTITADAQGNGTAETTLANVPWDTVTGQAHYVQYHVAANPPGPQVSCADIPRAAAGGAAAPAPTARPAGQGGVPAGAPATGVGGGGSNSEGLPLTWLLLGGLSLLVVGAGASYAFARQRK